MSKISRFAQRQSDVMTFIAVVPENGLVDASVSDGTRAELRFGDRPELLFWDHRVVSRYSPASILTVMTVTNEFWSIGEHVTVESNRMPGKDRVVIRGSEDFELQSSKCIPALSIEHWCINSK